MIHVASKEVAPRIWYLFGTENLALNQKPLAKAQASRVNNDKLICQHSGDWKQDSMATKTASARLGRSIKKPSKPVAKSKVAGKTPATAAKAWLAQWAAREQQYSDIFGTPAPKGKALSLEGECITAKAAAQQGICIMQYAPRSERMSWLYVTQGLSLSAIKPVAKQAPVELALHWKVRDSEVTAKVLSQLAHYVLEVKRALTPGEIISADDRMNFKTAGFQHWLTCPADKVIAAQAQACKSTVNFLVLIGITDAEMQYALKVNPELADGRKVLTEALLGGGVFPVTDADRTCLTRRRDFNRIWETAFRTVRESKQKASH
jgi:hypothetical protein